MDHRTFRLSFGKDTYAACHAEHKNKKRLARYLFFQRSHLRFCDLVHELTHAYMSYFPLHKMSKDMIEEAFCTVQERHILHIVRIARKLGLALKA